MRVGVLKEWLEAPPHVALGDALVADKEGPAAKTAYDKALTLPNVDAAAVRAKIAAIH